MDLTASEYEINKEQVGHQFVVVCTHTDKVSTQRNISLNEKDISRKGLKKYMINLERKQFFTVRKLRWKVLLCIRCKQ